jgi:hypothetical protein
MALTDFKVQNNMDEYQRKGPNDLSLPKRIMRFIKDNANFKGLAQGIIGITSDKLWEMTDEEFQKTFGITFKEEIAPNSEESMPFSPYGAPDETRQH